MSAFTTRYRLTKPTVGGDADAWGGLLNTDMDQLDVLLSPITTTGSSNAYVLTTGQSLTAYEDGQTFMIRASFGNTGAATMNIDGLGAKNLRKRVSGTLTALASGDIYSDDYLTVTYLSASDVIVIHAQALDPTLAALAALSWSSGTLVITMTAADTFALTASPVLSAPQVTTLEIGHASDTTLSRVSAGVAAIEGQTILTGANPQVTTIELGNASDTTLARGAPGQPTVEGSYLLIAGKIAVPIPASAMVANITNGPSSGTTETTTNKVMYRTLDFDTTTQESAQFLIPMPKGWNEGTVTFQACWTFASSSGGVVWELAGVAFSDDDAIDAAFGTAQQVADTALTAGDAHWTSESSAITIAGSPAASDLVIFRVRRVPADASDTLGADAKLIAIRLFITTDAPNDA